MTNLKPTGDWGRGGQRSGRGRDFDRDGGNRGNRGNRGRRGRGGDNRYREEQNGADYMGREAGRGGNRNRDREENKTQEETKGPRQTRQPRVRMVDNQEDFPEIM